MLPYLLGLHYTESVLLDGEPHGFLVRRVHYRFGYLPVLVPEPIDTFFEISSDQRLTMGSEHDSDSFPAIFFEEMPCALSNIIWFRFYMDGLESKCSMYSNTTLCFLVRFTSVILIIYTLLDSQNVLHVY